MGGSQLKSLKATLKANDLTGQTPSKKKKRSKRPAKKYDNEERENLIARIREQFNPFEVKTSKNKHGLEKGTVVGKPGISKQIGELQRQNLFEVKRSRKNRRGGIIDRRFGERNINMTEEEKMLERFTREKQRQSELKTSLFDLNDADEDGIFGTKLTHLGRDLEDDFDEGDLGISKEDEIPNKRKHGTLLDEHEPEPVEEKKRTKAEVMKEVIAKSKFYKLQRQKDQGRREDQIEELDDGFDDIMSELRNSKFLQNSRELIPQVKDKEKEYDIKVKKLIMDKRAAPANRTKTEEELRKQEENKRKELEQQRIDRMSGIVVDEEGRERGIDDLDDDFWGSDEGPGESGDEMIADSDEDVQLSSGEENDDRQLRDFRCPSDHAEFMDIAKCPISEHPKLVKKIIKAYQPKLAEGNKDKLAKFTGVLLRHIMFLSDQKYSSDVSEFNSVQNSLLSILKVMSEKYNRSLSDTCRDIINEIQMRFKTKHFAGLSVSDLTFLAIVGYLFSTSDQYHLIVTPCSILIAQFLEQIKFNSLQKLAFGAVLVRISLQYQRLSRRYIPEVTYFVEKSLATFLGNENYVDFNVDIYALKLCDTQVFSKELPPTTIRFHEIFENQISEDLKVTVFLNILDSLNTIITRVWNNLPAYEEIIMNTEFLLNEIIILFPELKMAHQILGTIGKLKNLRQHYPLTLQYHKPIAIPSYAPRFEENFNPEKRSYDPSRTRNELQKMKAELKKERKFTMKEIRKDTKFEARRKIEEDRSNAAKYHAKMAQIVNTINTDEGAEKNKYDREKRLRTGKK